MTFFTVRANSNEMGGAVSQQVSSKLKKRSPKRGNVFPGSPIPIIVIHETPPCLCPQEIRLVKQSWTELQSDMVKVGVVMFTRLFETHPDVQDAFMDFRHMSLEDMRHSKTLREHGLRVMTTVEKVLARVDDPAKLDAFLHHLGTKHVNYNANKNYIQLVGPQFVKSIKSELEDVWTSETERAWYKLFDYIAYFMKKGMESVVT
ncbi:neuroglobin-like isoform X1 [Liolophura sinensis]|uniref:neuroglobin-like isoform X1 n=1 Tax=Liolophura sinensis TaxID=3198878 RepID=UPI0031584B46